MIDSTAYTKFMTDSSGKILGHPNVLSDAQKIQTIQRLQEGKAVAAIARDLNVNRQTVMRVRNCIN